MNISEILGIIGAGLVTVAFVVYLFDILFGTTRPHPVSWAVWCLIGILGVGGTFQAGAGAGGYVPLAYLVSCVCIFGLSLFGYGKSGGKRYDVPLGLAAAGVLIFWRIDHWPPAVAVATAIAADTAVASLTLRDAWRNPSSESLVAWSISATGAVVGVAAVQHFSFSALGYPCYIALANTLTASALLIRHHKHVAVMSSMAWPP